MGYCPEDLPKSPLTSGTCCYCVSLRMGSMILAGCLTFGGAVGVLMGGSGWIEASFLQLLVGGLGLYAAYHRDLRCLKLFILVVMLALLVHLALIALLFLLKPKILAPANTGACEDAADPERCRQMVTGFRGNGMAQVAVLELAFSGCLNLWVLIVVDSFRQVLAGGGSGDEKLSPKEVAAGSGVNERSSLNP